MKETKILCFIPARGGSKSIPYKNIVKLRGKELIKYTIDKVLSLKEIDKIIVSTDSSKIINKISSYKKNSKFQIIKRPPKYSKDNSSTEEALSHTLEYLQNKSSYSPTHIIILEPTSPIRKIISIKKFINEVIKNKKFNSFVSVVKFSADPLFMNKKKELEFIRKEQPRRRQLRQKLYTEASGMYGITYKNFIFSRNVVMKPIFPFIVSKLESIDINDSQDLIISDLILSKKIND